MTEHIDECPVCGGRALRAVTSQTVEYLIRNGRNDHQDWERDYIDWGLMTVDRIDCGGCGANFDDFTLDRGNLVGLGEPSEEY